MPAPVRYDNTVQLVKEAADILAVVGEVVNLRRGGATWKGLCPFHNEKTPSFTVNPARRAFHCFGCQEGGDVIAFMMKYHRLSFPEAVKELARRYNIALPEEQFSREEQERARLREKLFALNDRVASLFHRTLLESAEAAEARAYLERRGMPADIIGRFRLGYAPDRWDFLAGADGEGFPRADLLAAGLIVQKERGGYYDRFRGRVIFPIFTPAGQVAGFGGRILGDGQPKYMNSPESAVFDKSRTLFGLFQTKEAIRRGRQCLVVEGNFDLLALVASGVENVAAPLGTALTQWHVRQLKGYSEEAILLFDGDAAGVKAALRAVPLFLTEQLPARVVVLPPGEDPDSFVRKEGAEALRERLTQAQPLADFVYERLVAQHGLSLEGKGRIVSELQPLLADMGANRLQRNVFLAHFSQKLGIPPEQLDGASGSAQTRMPVPPAAQQRPREVPASPSPHLAQLLRFLIVQPEFLPSFLEAGLEEVAEEEAHRELLSSMRALAQSRTGCTPEALLEMLPAGPARAFVSETLIIAPFAADQDRDEEARSKLAWLRRMQVRARSRQLQARIALAARENNQELLLALAAEKSRLDREGL